MLLMAEKGTRGGICQAIHRYGKANNKYMKNYDKNTTSSHVFRCKQFVRMSQKLPVNGFKWVKSYLNLVSAS